MTTAIIPRRSAAPAAPASSALHAAPEDAPNAARDAAPASPAAIPATAWLADRAALDEATRGALSDALADPETLVNALLAADRPAEALRVVACALPPREGVWWAWVAARHAAQVARARPAGAQHAALAATERWIAQPTDEHRRAAWDAARAAGLETPAGCAAGAVYFTGGSITPPNGPFVPPPAGVHVTIAATAVLLAAVATDAARLRDVAGVLARQGVEIVRQLGGWDAAVAAATRLFDAQAREHAEASKPPKLPEHA